MTPLQKYTAQAIVNILETGCPDGDYSAVSVIPGDNGHLSYGRAQVSLASGDLRLLVAEYCARPRAAHAESLRPYLERLRARDLTLNRDPGLLSALVAAGADPLMHAVQDRFFDRIFWEPALKVAARSYVQTPLGIAVIFDSFIQGSWASLKCSVNAHYGRPPRTREECWIEFYVRARHRFLDNLHPPLPASTCRMEPFESLIHAANWTLALPITVRGVTISAPALKCAA